MMTLAPPLEQRPRQRCTAGRLRRPGRGAASLIVVMGLLLVLLLGAAYAGRDVLLEQKASAAQYHGTQAFEAAEAGLEWTLAQLNGGRIDALCRPSSDPAGLSLRERALVLADPSTGAFAAAPPAGSVSAPACLRGSDGAWRCSCPASGSSTPSGGEDASAIQPAFRVELAGASPHGSAQSYPGIVQLRSHGCVNSHGGSAACADGDGVMLISEQAALLPALSNLPVATLSAQGHVAAAGPGLGLHNAQPGGLLLDAGADVDLGAAQRTVAAGASGDEAVVAHDPAQSPPRAQARFLALFGVPAASFAQLPAVVSLHCPPDCTGRLHAALAQGARMLWIDNDLTVSNLAIGSADAPVLLVAAGALHFEGNVRCTGLVHGSSWQWRGGEPGNAWLHGAAVIEGDVQLEDAADLAYDLQALATLQRLTGSFVRVPGSWTDIAS